MLRLVSDENFNGDIVRGLLRRHPELELVRVQDVGLMQTPDPDILEWAASRRRTAAICRMQRFRQLPIKERDGKLMPGVFIVVDRMPIGQAIDEILFLSLDVEPDEWKDQVLCLPLK